MFVIYAYIFFAVSTSEQSCYREGRLLGRRDGRRPSNLRLALGTHYLAELKGWASGFGRTFTWDL